ncbi:MAG: MFS transporter [Candidatus Moranbacteria bacterium]|nr:MFS transporter [Candidatus Moranbacteria bacterium]
MSKRVFPVLFATILLDMIGIGMLIPVLPIIFTDPSSPAFILEGYSVSAQYTMAGLLTALFGLMQFISAPLLGELSDVYGRKKLLTLGVGILALSQLLFGFGIETGSLLILFISRIIAGIAGGNFSIAQASIADITAPEFRARNFGLIGVAVGVGFIIGPMLGGFIVSATGNAAMPFWFAAALGIINVISISLFLDETHTNRKAEKNFHIWKGIHNIQTAWRDLDARPVYLASFLYTASFTFFTSFIGILLVARFGLSESAIGTFFGAVGFWIIVTQAFILRIISHRYRERQVLRFTIIMMAISLSLYPFVPSLIWIYTIIPLLAIPNGLTMANMTALISKSVGPSKQGAALGINGSLMALAQGTIPLLAGFGSGVFGIAAPFLAGSLLALGSWYFLFLRRR